MRAALRFVRGLIDAGEVERTSRLRVDLYGSLALTGVGHGTDRAVLLGLMGQAPESIDLAQADEDLARVRDRSRLLLGGVKEIAFTTTLPPGEAGDLRMWQDQMYPRDGKTTHPNGMRFRAFDASGEIVADEIYFSVGGGFIVSEREFEGRRGEVERDVPYGFRSARELLDLAEQHRLTIAEIVMANECALLEDSRLQIARPGDDAGAAAKERIEGGVLAIWRVMDECIERGLKTEGILPGGLKVRRRAPGLAWRVTERRGSGQASDPLAALDLVTMWAMAVNEENAAGGRVVTAPTNGAAGVIPAVARYFLEFGSLGRSEDERRSGLLQYFLTAAAIGILYKENASISGAEVGCQGEVGVACSMAAAGLAAALGASNDEVEHAAEIAMEHNLGMTCDPIGGLVQIPCIERNGMGAVKAIHASRIAMNGTEGHKLSLDQVIRTMYQTGLDMQSRYKETSLAGLALNVIEC